MEVDKPLSPRRPPFRASRPFPHFRFRLGLSLVWALLGWFPAKHPRAAGRPARMHYLAPRSWSPSQAPTTPPLASSQSLSLPHPHLPASSPGPQVRTTAEFHAPRRPASSGEGKGRRGPVPAEVPGAWRTPRFGSAGRRRPGGSASAPGARGPSHRASWCPPSSPRAGWDFHPLGSSSRFTPDYPPLQMTSPCSGYSKLKKLLILLDHESPYFLERH